MCKFCKSRHLEKAARRQAADEARLNARGRTKVQRKYTVLAQDGGKWTTDSKEGAIAILDKFDGATESFVRDDLFVGFERLNEL